MKNMCNKCESKIIKNPSPKLLEVLTNMVNNKREWIKKVQSGEIKFDENNRRRVL